MKHSFWDRLNLTDDQKKKLKQVREVDRDELGNAWAQVKMAQESLPEALLANPENTADIQAKATDLARALSAKSIQVALHEAKINQILTPVQRVGLDEAFKNHRNYWPGRAPVGNMGQLRKGGIERHPPCPGSLRPEDPESSRQLT